jgi:hypothetical protein
MTLRCSDCDQPVGLLRITRNYVRLGHIREPKPIHPVRLPPVRPSTEQGLPAVPLTARASDTPVAPAQSSAGTVPGPSRGRT